MQRWVLGGPLIDGGVDPDKQPARSGGTHRSKRLRLWVNWALAVLTVLGAAACSEKQCPNLRPNWISFDVPRYGAPVVAALTIVVSFFTAQRRWGIVVPIFALALLVADITILAVTLAQ